MLPGMCSAKIPELWPKPSLGMLWGSYGVVLALLEPRYCCQSAPCQRDVGGVTMWPPQSSWLWVGYERPCPCVGLGWVVEPAFP